MKKLGAFLAGVGLLASATFAADSNTATSVNAVGFVQVNVPAGKFVMAAVPFNGFSNNVDALLWGQLTGTDEPATADLVYVFNSSSQTYTRYWKADGVGGGYDGHMIDPSGRIATNSFLSPGQGFWIKSQSASNQVVVMSGEVPNGLQATNTIRPGFNMLCLPYSMEMNIGTNTGLFASGGVGSDEPATSDLIYVFNPITQTYTRYWLANNVGAQYDGKFIDPTGSVATQKVDVGTGFWYVTLSSSNINWIVNRPYPSVSN